MKELSLLADALRVLDNDPDFTMHFWENPARHSHVVMGLLHDAVIQEARRTDTCISTQQNRFDQAASRLMSEFWSHTYPSHDCHFHKSFTEFLNCPFTCLTEIVDCVSKIASLGGS